MPNYQKYIIAGHLLRDPAMKFLQNQTAVCECGIAETEKYKDKESTVFMDFTIFGKPAETFNQYMKKGSACLLEGKLKTDSWEDKNGGGKRSKVVMIVDKFTFLGGKQDGGGKSDTPSTDDLGW